MSGNTVTNPVNRLVELKAKMKMYPGDCGTIGDDSRVCHDNIKYVISPTKGHVGTLFCRKQGNHLYFGWSRYNRWKEKAERVPFTKQIGRDEAVKALSQPIFLYTDTGILTKGSTEVKDHLMISEAIAFIGKMRLMYNIKPSNVHINLSINYLQKLLKNMALENKKLFFENRKLRKKLNDLRDQL